MNSNLLLVWLVVGAVLISGCAEKTQKPTTTTTAERVGTTMETPDEGLGEKQEKCPDGIWDEAEQANPELCPEDKPDKLGDEEIQSGVEIQPSLDIVYKIDKTPQAGWVPEGKPGAPWLSALYFATSNDGVHFEGKQLFIHHAGVPNLLLTKDNTLIAVFQYFSYEYLDMYDIIAYTYSTDLGKTWQPVKRLEVPGTCNLPRFKCNDPMLVETEDGRLRLYFSHNEPGVDASVFSAITDDMDTPFTNEGQQLLAMDFADPAIAYFNGEWHHYSVHESATRDKQINVHSTSKDGLNFTRQENFEAEMGFLGHALSDGDRLLFYNGGFASSSKDGYNWEYLGSTGVEGADPGVVKMPDGTYLMLYVTHFSE